MDTVESFKVEGLTARLSKRLGITEAEADALFLRAKEFMLTAKDNSPDRDVDEAWHDFILFTREYHEFCEKFCGGYVHHVPTVRDEAKATCFGTKCHKVIKAECKAYCTKHCMKQCRGVQIAA